MIQHHLEALIIHTSGLFDGHCHFIEAKVIFLFVFIVKDVSESCLHGVEVLSVIVFKLFLANGACGVVVLFIACV